AQIKAIQQQHMTVKRWGDIGYHFLIDPSGRIWQGRQLRFQGAHATGEGNVGNVGICLLGNFMRTRRGKERGQEPTREQVAAMRQLVAELMRKHNFGADAIFRHYDFRDTECPGELMTPIVSQMVKDFRRNALGEQ
ncbi:MAG: peptidoglycan recognition family protein, partial [Planctomycetota bacterium]